MRQAVRSSTIFIGLNKTYVTYCLQVANGTCRPLDGRNLMQSTQPTTYRIPVPDHFVYILMSSSTTLLAGGPVYNTSIFGGSPTLPDPGNWPPISKAVYSFDPNVRLYSGLYICMSNFWEANGMYCCSFEAECYDNACMRLFLYRHSSGDVLDTASRQVMSPTEGTFDMEAKICATVAPAKYISARRRSLEEARNAVSSVLGSWTYFPVPTANQPVVNDEIVSNVLEFGN